MKISASIRWMIAVAALTLWVSFAAEIDGKWTGQVQGRNGPQTQTLMLKADGNTLTGTIEGGRGGPVQITDGKIDGGNVFFKVIREFQDNKITQEYKGAVSEGELKLTVSGGRGGPAEVTYKKE
jgi:hypothetical protein